MSSRHKLIEDYPISYRALSLNAHHDTSGDFIREAAEDCYDVVQFDFSPMSIRDQIEGLHVDSGADVGVASKEFRRITIRGLVKGSTAAKLADRVATLFNVFDVEEAQQESPGSEGVSALDFFCPTEDPPSGFTSPVQECFLVRPRGFPVVYERKSQGLAYHFAVELVAPDPRRYLFTPYTVVFSDGAGWAQPMFNWIIGLGAETYPIVTIVTTGPGSSAFTITDQWGGSFILDLSGVGAVTISVFMDTMDIAIGGVLRDDLRASGVASFFGVPRGGSTWTIANTTNIASVTAVYRAARS